MNITEFFKWMIETKEYDLGDYMCWMVEGVFEDGAVPSECTMTEHDIVTHINVFLRYINDHYEVNLCDEDDEPASYAMMTVLSTARTEELCRNKTINRDAINSERVCMDIYSNWDKRFEIAEAYIKHGKRYEHSS